MDFKIYCEALVTSKVQLKKTLTVPGVGSNSSFSDATGEGGRISRGLRNLNWRSFPGEQNRF